ncbi:MAG: cell division protein FtsA [Brevinema sp.]
MNSRYQNQKSSPAIAGLDMGSHRINVVIAKNNSNGYPEILGASSVVSRGIRKGVVINLEHAAMATTAAIEQAELQAGVTVDSVLLGVSGGHIASTSSQGLIAVPNNREITLDDVQRVIEAATTVIIPPDREIIHVLPEEFSVDSEKGIKDPVGMIGSRLEVKVHIITVAATSVNNLIKSVYKAGFNTSDIFLKSLAATHAILNEEEKEEGCVLVDIGAGTTDFVVFLDGGMKHNGQLSIGGGHVTNDISYGLKTTTHIAEHIKCAYGSAIAEKINIQDQFEMPNPSGRSDRIESTRLLVEIIQPRLEEILFLVNEDLEKTGLKPYLSSGVVLTGGVACTENIDNLAMQVFQLPVRIGTPSQVRGLNESVRNPVLSTATGLALYGLRNKPKHGTMTDVDDDKNFQNIVHRIQDWFNEFF